MRCTLVSILVVGFAGTASADVESGPKAGAAIAPLKVFAVTGAIEGKELDYAKERKDEPTVYFFVNAEKFSRPMNKFMLAIDGKLADASDKALSVIVWTSGDFEKNKEHMPSCRSPCRMRSRR